jgi:hypothetical protein
MKDRTYKSSYSKTGLALTGLYLLLTIISIVWALNVSDPKGKTVFLQLPIAIQLAVIQELGLIKALYGFSWYIIYPLIVIPTLFILYYIGNFMSLVTGLLFNKDKRNK